MIIWTESTMLNPGRWSPGKIPQERFRCTIGGTTLENESMEKGAGARTQVLTP